MNAEIDGSLSTYQSLTKNYTAFTSLCAVNCPNTPSDLLDVTRRSK
jgi:hypothetical protein